MDEDENLCKLKKMTKQKKIKNVETLKIKELSRSNNITAVPWKKQQFYLKSRGDGLKK